MSLSALQELVKQRLDAHVYFSDATATTPRPIAVISEDRGDIENAIDTAIAQIGLAVIVKMPSLKNLELNKLPANSEAQIVIRIGENPVINRDENTAAATLKHCSDVALAVFQRLHQWKPATAWTKVECTQITPQEDLTLQIYTLTLKTQTQLGPL